jgi:hypothetical protein
VPEILQKINQFYYPCDRDIVLTHLETGFRATIMTLISSRL